MNLENWLIYVLLTFVAAIVPGPAVLLVSANSFAYGVKNSVATIAGNSSGLLVLSLIAVVGVSASIMSSVFVFTAVKVIGAMYLIYFGVSIWRGGMNFPLSNSIKDVEPLKKVSIRSLYFQGLAVALSNPKAIAFTTALFPQFIVLENALFPQFIILVGTLIFLSSSCQFSYAVLVNKTIRTNASEGVLRIIGRTFGAVFMVSGVAIIFG